MQAVGDNRLLSSNGFPFAPEGAKHLTTEFGYECYAVNGIEYSIESINEFFGMTDNYSRGLQIMLLGRLSRTQATVV